MSIDFHDQSNRTSYATRTADVSWILRLQEICAIKNKHVLDIGCGGGIYTKALAEMGAASVTGVDFSEEQLTAASENCKAYSNITFHHGHAFDTGLQNGEFDIILTRAVIHHLDNLPAFFNEASRLLKPGGVCLTQDRTSEDCLIEGSDTHIRGYFFSKFPFLAEKETGRRPTSQKVTDSLKSAGFTNIEGYALWETRKTYREFSMLEKDLLARTGRSILHELTDRELIDLIAYIKDQIGNKAPLTEKDRWTIWKAIKS